MSSGPTSSASTGTPSGRLSPVAMLRSRVLGIPPQNQGLEVHVGAALLLRSTAMMGATEAGHSRADANIERLDVDPGHMNAPASDIGHPNSACEGLLAELNNRIKLAKGYTASVSARLESIVSTFPHLDTMTRRYVTSELIRINATYLRPNASLTTTLPVISEESGSQRIIVATEALGKHLEGHSEGGRASHAVGKSSCTTSRQEEVHTSQPTKPSSLVCNVATGRVTPELALRVPTPTESNTTGSGLERLKERVACLLYIAANNASSTTIETSTLLTTTAETLSSSPHEPSLAHMTSRAEAGTSLPPSTSATHAPLPPTACSQSLKHSSEVRTGVPHSTSTTARSPRAPQLSELSNPSRSVESAQDEQSYAQLKNWIETERTIRKIYARSQGTSSAEIGWTNTIPIHVVLPSIQVRNALAAASSITRIERPTNPALLCTRPSLFGGYQPRPSIPTRSFNFSDVMARDIHRIKEHFKASSEALKEKRRLAREEHAQQASKATADRKSKREAEKAKRVEKNRRQEEAIRVAKEEREKKKQKERETRARERAVTIPRFTQPGTSTTKTTTMFPIIPKAMQASRITRTTRTTRPTTNTVQKSRQPTPPQEFEPVTPPSPRRIRSPGTSTPTRLPALPVPSESSISPSSSPRSASPVVPVGRPEVARNPVEWESESNNSANHFFMLGPIPRYAPDSPGPLPGPPDFDASCDTSLPPMLSDGDELSW